MRKLEYIRLAARMKFRRYRCRCSRCEHRATFRRMPWQMRVIPPLSVRMHAVAGGLVSHHEARTPARAVLLWWPSLPASRSTQLLRAQSV